MKRKKLIITIGVMVLLAGGMSILKPFSSDENETRYKTEKVRKGSLQNLVSSTGTLSALETIEVGSQVSGILNKLYVDFNSPVKKGQLLAILDKTLFRVAVNDKEASLNKAKATLNRVNAEVKRNKPLFEKGHISETEFLVIKTEAEKARADVQIASAALKKARTNLEYCEIKSPIDGTIIERSIDEGQTIAASFQAPQLFVVAEDLTRMQIEAQVDESDIGLIRQGQTVQFTVQAYSEKNFEGKVRQIRLQPETLQNVVNYTVIVDAPNDDRLLLPGMTAMVDFVIEDATDVLLISNKAFNWTPSEENMKKFAENMRAQRLDTGGRMNNQAGGAQQTEFKKPENIEKVFLVDNDNNLSMAVIKKGITDGLKTEIREIISGNLTEGNMVIFGNDKLKTSKGKNTAKNTLLPVPGRGPGPR